MKTELTIDGYDRNEVTDWTPADNARNYSGEKELVNSFGYCYADADGTIHRPIDAHFWMGRSKSASVVYCSIWIHSTPTTAYCSGRGTAGGGGYHKESAALQDAINSAGFTLAAPINGYGDHAMKVAIEAIARHLNLPKGSVL